MFSPPTEEAARGAAAVVATMVGEAAITAYVVGLTV